MPKRETFKRELLALAHTAEGTPQIGDWFMSEKLDGTRCFWDGGVSRGVPTRLIPWASLKHPKTGELKPIHEYATGLWSRYGNPIIAPDWFIDQLPQCLLDGELFAGRGNFQLCRSIVSKDVPIDDEWEKISYAIYGGPSLEAICSHGHIKNQHADIEVHANALSIVEQIAKEHGKDLFWAMPNMTFADTLELLGVAVSKSNIAYLHLQQRLPKDNDAAWKMVNQKFEQVLAEKGEGVIVRNPNAFYEVKRTSNLLKVKPSSDADAVITGFTAGKNANLGKIGALIVDYQGKTLKLSGMESELRTLMVQGAGQPGKPLVNAIAKYFQIGDVVEFKYRELSDAGIPKEARFERVKRRKGEAA